MGAVDEVVVGRRRRIDLVDGGRQRRAIGQPSVRLDRERHHDREPRQSRGPDHPDRLTRFSQGVCGEPVGARRGEGVGLRLVVALGLVGVDRAVRAVAVAARADHLADRGAEAVPVCVATSPQERTASALARARAAAS
ncbi:MAG: hypothetical protein ABJA74_03160 [Lapillicoccus sp.]